MTVDKKATLRSSCPPGLTKQTTTRSSELTLMFSLVVTFFCSTAGRSSSGDLYPSGTSLQVWTCVGDFHQQWKLVPSTGGSYFIIFKYNNRCVDVSWWYKDSKVLMAVRDCHPNYRPDNQQYYYKNGQFISLTSGKCLEVAIRNELGSFVWTNDCNITNPAQQWSYNAGSGVIRSGLGSCLDVGHMYTCDDQLRHQPWCNWTVPVRTRVDALLSEMTIPEMISQMGNVAPPVSRLGVAQYNWDTECLHGVMSPCGSLGCPTSFPSPSALGATFNTALISAIASAISTEARALHNEGGISLAGLTYWAPNININRDPRWGRNMEVPGEDPYLTSQYLQHFVRGLQEGDDHRYAKVVSTCKHLAAYSLENWGGVDRHHFNAIVDDYDLVDTYLPAWQACAQLGRARSVMCSYNALNGVPTCASEFLMQTILRDSYGFDGYVVSDCGAIADIIYTHNYTHTPASTCSVALKAGCDLNCGTTSSFYQYYMNEAVAAGLVTVADMRKALERTFRQRFELGMFDPLDNQIYTKIPPSAVGNSDHSFLALQAAREAIVLLKNEKNVLPLHINNNNDNNNNDNHNNIKKIAVIGPNAGVRNTLLGDYYGQRCMDGSYNCVEAPVEAIQRKIGASNVVYERGCDINSSDKSGFNAAVEALNSSDVGLVFLGIDGSIEGEGQDRTRIDLPGVQSALVEALMATGKPVVVILINGGALSIEWIKNHSHAILEAWYPGQSGAAAIADVIFGDYNPGGKLPVTIYKQDYVSQVSLFDMSMRPSAKSPGRTYRYFTGTPLWEFGFGLSYTTFNMTWEGEVAPLVMDLRKNSEKSEKSVEFRVWVTNTGSVAGDEVVLAFITRQKGQQGPLKQLFGFQRVHLRPGESKEVFFTLPANALAIPTGGKELRRIVIPGNYHVEIGVGEGKLRRSLQVLGEKPLMMGI
jgi:beta-glucosidase-like glycosyl hydrolase